MRFPLKLQEWRVGGCYSKQPIPSFTICYLMFNIYIKLTEKIIIMHPVRKLHINISHNTILPVSSQKSVTEERSLKPGMC